MKQRENHIKTKNVWLYAHKIHRTILHGQYEGITFYDASYNLVSMNLNGVEYYYIRNGQGDITGLFDGSGKQVVSYTYDSWGKLISIKDGSGKDITSDITSIGYKNPYRYRGYRYDSEMGLYYLQSRYYNAEWGRFVNGDGITGATGELLSHNMFNYCKDNPINMCDDSGYNPLLVSMAVGAGIGALISGGINLASQLTSDKKFSWGSLGVALASGDASGALTGSGVGIFAAIAGNAGISAGSYMAGCGNNFNWIDLAANTFLGGLFGVIGGKGAFQDIGTALTKADLALISRSCGSIKQSVCKTSLNNAYSVVKHAVLTNSRKAVESGVVSTVMNNLMGNNGNNKNSGVGHGGGGRCYQLMY